MLLTVYINFFENAYVINITFSSRFLPTSHPLLHKLTKDLGLEIEKLYSKEDCEKNHTLITSKGNMSRV